VNIIQSTSLSSKSSSESFFESLRSCTAAVCELQHDSSAMHEHASVQERPVLEQEQLPRQYDFPHLQVVSSTRLLGAGSYVMYTGLKHPSSSSHPCSSGLSKSCIPTSELLQLYTKWHDRFRCSFKQSDVGGSISLLVFRWHNINYRNSSVVPVLLLVTGYSSQMKASILVAVISSKSCCRPNKPRVV